MPVRTTIEPPIPTVAAVGSPSRLNGARRIHFCIYMVKFIRYCNCPEDCTTHPNLCSSCPVVEALKPPSPSISPQAHCRSSHTVYLHFSLSSLSSSLSRRPSPGFVNAV